MKYIIGVLLIIAGIALGLYLGVWVLFVGGIVNIINGVKHNPVQARTIAWGIAEVFILAEVIGGGIAFVLGSLGFGIMGMEDYPKVNRRKKNKAIR